MARSRGYGGDGPASIFVPFGEWLPDQPDFKNPGASTIKNVLPRTAQSYGPIATPVAYSSALTARCQGTYTTQDSGAGAQVFAGDATKLYTLNTGSSATFSDVSRLVGGAYATPAIPDGFWSMTSFGSRVVACNNIDAPQTYLIGTDTHFSALSSGAPVAKFCAVVRDFLVLANVYESGQQTQRVHWSGIGDATNWPTVGSNAALQVQSDIQDLQQTDLGQISGLIGGGLSGTDGAVFCEHGIWRMDYQAGPIFDFAVAQGAAGTLSPRSIVRGRLITAMGSRSVVYYVGEDLGFYAFDGALALPIGNEKVDRFFAADVDPTYIGSVLGAADPTTSLVFWLYCAAGSGGLYNRMIAYNWQIQRFSYIDLTSTPLEDASQMLTLGKTLDQLDAFGNIDTLPYSLDSRVWAGGSPTFACFNNSHQLAYFTGSAMAPTVQTSEAQLIAGRRAKIISARPIADGGTPSIAIATRDRLIDSVTYGSAVAVNSIGESPQLTTGRYVRAQMTLPAASTFTHLQGVEITAIPEGKQ